MKKNRIRFLTAFFSAVLLLSSMNVCAVDATTDADASMPTYATVERIKTEILTAEIIRTADVLQVAEYYMDADLETTGISATINSDGRIQITQILEKNDSDFVSAMCTAGLGSAIANSDVATSVLLVLDAEGNEKTASDYEQASGGLNEYSVYAVHTAYYESREQSFFDPIEVRTTQLVTRFTYGTAIKASQLVHTYSGTQSGFGDDTDNRTYSAITPSSAGVSYTNNVYGYWYKVGSGYYPHLDSTAVITVGSKVFTLSTRREL